MRWNTVFFDLDGTLTDSAEGITASAAYALKYFGIEAAPETLMFFIGPPINETLMEKYGFSEEQASEGVKKYREYYSVYGWKENRLYPHVDELLKKLKSTGLRLAVATSKPEEYTLRILDYFGISEYFEVVGSAPMNDFKSGRKAAVVKRTAEKMKITDTSEVLMIGDRMHDVKGAHANGIKVAGVLYGYGSRGELEEYGADYIVNDLKELESLLLNDN